MTILWTHDDMASATGGRTVGQWQARRVEIDSRKIQPGDLFVALIGENFDGHRFVADALAKGAVAAIVSRVPDLPAGSPLLIVADTHKALVDLGVFARKRAKAKIVGVTGSVGKTSTREMIRLALAAHGDTYATSGNYNNHIGTPLTLANMPPEAAFAVFEMGMNHAGEIAQLTRWVRPHITLITTVESVHLEFFASEEGIADAKAEIFEGLEAGGLALLNADNRWFTKLARGLSEKNIRMTACGESPSAQCRLLDYAPFGDGAALRVSIHGEAYDVQLGARGKHWGQAVLFALAIAHELGLDVARSASALSAFCEVDGRGRVIALGNGAFLIDDSYNASPASMRAAFATLAERDTSGRRIAVLGDMLELGASAQALHAGLAEDLTRLPIDKVFTAGTLMAALHDVLPTGKRADHARTVAELCEAVAKAMAPGDTVLVKGSHGSHMYELAHFLKEHFGAL